MSEEFSTKRLLALRRVTRKAAELMTFQLKDHLQTVNHVFRPRTMFGDFVAGQFKEPARGADLALVDLKSQYATVATAKPFTLPKEFPQSIDNPSSIPEIATSQYWHPVSIGGKERRLEITSPLRWVLFYGSFPPNRILELIRGREQTIGELQRAVLHYLMMHVIIQRQPGIQRLFTALRFPIEFGRIEGCGELPIPIINALVPTVRPPDEIVAESTEISGLDAFEEVVDLNAVSNLADPWKTQFTEMTNAETVLATA